jgi:P27 family predicted phage terminase small subunit
MGKSSKVSKKEDVSSAPGYLSEEARAIWDLLMEDYEFLEVQKFVLRTALEAFDRMREAQKLIKENGITQEDRFGQIKAHPACQVEQVSRDAWMRGLRELGLDLEPLRDGPGRPAGR